MRGVAGLVLLLSGLRLSRPCYREATILICQEIPSHFDPGCSTLVMFPKNVGEINSTVFHSDSLMSITKLTFNNAGITGIDESAFSSLPNLRNLSLDGNMLSQMSPGWFGDPSVLTEISLTQNLFEVVDKFMLHGLVSLKSLRLNENRISAIGVMSFSSLTTLAELDLSENRLTRVSPQVFRSLNSTRIRLDGNPWDCSCGVQDFVDFLKDLQSRSLLDRQMDVTCETPPSLKGRPVWNVSVCMTTSSPESPRSDHSDGPTLPASTAEVVTTPSPRPTLKTESSVQPKPTEAPILSTRSATLSSLETSVQPKPTDSLTSVTTSASNSGPHVTSPPSGTNSSIHPKPTKFPSKPTDLAVPTSSSSQPPQDTNIICILSAVIVVLCVLLFVVCFLALLRRRKCKNKTVTPGCPTEEKKKKLEEEEHGSSRDLEEPWRKSFTGVRAKSANAIILTSHFCASGKDQVTLQSEKTENHEERKQKVVDENVAEESQTENLTNTTDIMQKSEKTVDVGRNLEDLCVVPYLSIGTNQNKQSPDEKSTEGQRTKLEKVMGRISTWPPTAAQWQERCKMKENEEEGEEEGGGFTFGKQNITEKFPDEEKKMEMEQKMEANISSHDDSEQLKKEPELQDATNKTQKSQTQDLKPAEDPPQESSSKSDVRKEPSRAATGRRRAETRAAAGSKAPSGGASPDDETLLSGNEYAFMDLLHEVSHNNGRWTRERWRQMQANKQRR
ncbi:leucine-rich repeat-containing protein 24-like [Amphiprion ocellaris]|uniref:leucine-rich repeat-containing protein 24-like n=1 Tax=Amphiprion ocellaris TaxID=80972 RepID=UPI001649F000|nr:leucine-rich repeat-containing protein 24-like [Amphiprion ocellaris]